MWWVLMKVEADEAQLARDRADSDDGKVYRNGVDVSRGVPIDDDMPDDEDDGSTE